MITSIHPAFIFIAAALVVPFFKGKLKSLFVLLVPLFGLTNLLGSSMGYHYVIPFLDFQLILFRLDSLSFVFGLIFHVISFIALLYILNFKNDVEYTSGFLYAGSALGVIFAGDLLTFFIFWECLTVGSMFLILARKTKASLEAGYRYMMVHVGGGLILLAGIVMYIAETHSMGFNEIGLGSVATYLIFIGIGINCAWPIFHTWLTDAYPEATIGGVIFLSAFTTKTAVYALARAYPGADILIWIGTAMAAFPIFYAVVENDLRRVLAYSLINQVGFMVVGIGLGTELAINGSIAHAFNDVLFKALLFMSVGAVMYRTGKVNATDLGGLYKSMPFTCLFCVIGAASISAFPLFSGFVSKSMVQTAAADQHYYIVWFVLLFASAGVFHHAGIKIPFFTFFSHDAGHRVKEAPWNMLAAMGIAAFLCIFIGVFPQYLYAILPFQVDYQPYTLEHVLAQSQLLFFSAFAFCLLLLSGIYPSEIRAINIDTDWFYRKGSRLLYRGLDFGLNGLNAVTRLVVVDKGLGFLTRVTRHAPAMFLSVFMTPLWALAGYSAEERVKRRQYIYQRASRVTFPVGVAAIIAVIFIGALFFL
ncbi:MAG: Na(+)/H(+) antiporter subunit D [Candidatus Margulisbacteria bacterium]|nr:Na(+)/H(+) antiporter subunit D [Candidatus Margulisiibacteriota bacterium]